MAKALHREIAPVDAKTHEQLATRRRTVKTVRGYTIDVHRDSVFIGRAVPSGDSVCVPRRIWDKLIPWYMGTD